MDFARVAAETEYRAYTTEFDELRDIRSVFGEEALRARRDAVENYISDPDAFGIYTGDSGDAQALESAVKEFEDVVGNVVRETGIDPSATVIAFLLDNSGSLRGLGGIYARAMTRVCGVLDCMGFDTPVVGHTTVEWKGGQSREKWHAAGHPANPGRLNDFLVTVYKEPGEPMQEDDLRLYGLYNRPGYKENIDGEALAWIAGKVDELEATNKAIVFVNDGDFSIDDSTLVSNRRDILKAHRRAVIDEIDNSNISLAQVMATDSHLRTSEIDEAEFGGRIMNASELVHALSQVVGHVIRLQADINRRPSANEPSP